MFKRHSLALLGSFCGLLIGCCEPEFTQSELPAEEDIGTQQAALGLAPCRHTPTGFPTDPTVDSLMVNNAEDMLWYSETPLPPEKQSEICISLEVAPSITWWKGITAINVNGEQLAHVETKDERKGPEVACFSTRRRDLPNLAIELAKAKFLGIPTGMYCAFDLSTRKGKQLTFYWEKDG